MEDVDCRIRSERECGRRTEREEYREYENRMK
jgi:hypothetical protein